MHLSPTIIAGLMTIPLSATASEFKIQPRAMQIIIGTACQQLEDGQSKSEVYKDIRADLKVRGLSELEARQAAKVISQNVQSICGDRL